MRLASGHEALVARVLREDGGTGYGFSFRLDAGEARHMAEWAAGERPERPHIQPVLDHPWERAWIAQQAVDWNLEPGFAMLRWLP